MNEDHLLIRWPLYRQVTARIRELLRDKRPGDRIATEAELRKRFDVSLVTVRQALKELENEGLLERRHGSGTFVPETRIPRRHIGLLLDADPTHPQMSPYFPKLIQEIRLELKARGLSSRAYYGFAEPNGIGQGKLSCDDVLDDARLNRLNGLIAFYTKRDPAWTDVFKERSIPVVDLEFRYQQGLHSKKQFIKAALAHFREQGRHRLAVLASENPKYPIQAAFREELRARAPEYGLQLDDHLVDITASAWEAGMGWERFRDLWRSDRRKPDGLIVLSDLLFADCQKAILELRIPVPDALSVVVSSSDAMELNPVFPIHVHRLQTRMVAKREADCMIALLHGAELPAYHPLEITLELQGPGQEIATGVEACCI